MPLDTADTPLNAWVRALERTAPYARGEGLPLPALVAAQAERFGARPALADDDVALSYADLAARTVQAARWALAQGLAAGETVALMLPNCAEYVPLWLGITAVRGVAALVNPALAGDALLHALTIAEPRHLIVAGAFEDSVAAIADRLPPGLVIWGFGPRATRPRMDLAAAALSAAPLGPAERRPPALGDLALLIYTSGTTGLPKAARVSHRRVAEWSAWFAGMIDTQPEDRMYNCLPMFHSVGGVVAIGAMLVGGGSVLIRPRFSAAKFWDEIVAGGCTVFQYIGELCRYLVNSPPHPLETAHRLRLCCGNGLRGDVWPAFIARFRIPRILEFYAATEGNVSLYNVQGKPGAIGQVPAFLAHRFPVALVRCDPDTRALLRGADGLCMRCGPDEVGEALGRIDHGADAHGRPFEGYADGRATEAKIARDVLAPGDAWFRTGDLMRRDRAGLLLFRRSARRHLPLEGRERRDGGSCARFARLPRRCRGGGVWRGRSRRRGPRGDGDARRDPEFRSRRLRPRPRDTAAALCAPGLPADWGHHHLHGQFQAGDGAARARRLRPRGNQGSALRLGSCRGRLRAPRRRTPRPVAGRRSPLLSAANRRETASAARVFKRALRRCCRRRLSASCR